jgi:Copper transport outer membrane protein, MctB
MHQFMIDFRYHLVSLVSVFLALAVGIVLGAGPLKESLGSALVTQVSDLRKEKDGLRNDLDTANDAVVHRNDFITAVAPSLINGELTGRSVAVVSLPGVNGDLVGPLADGVTAAGGTVTARVTLNAAWADPAQAPARAKILQELLTKLPTSGTPTTDADARLRELLAGALVSSSAGSPQRSTEADATVLDSLRSADLIGIKGDVAGPAGGALVLAPAGPVSSGQVVKTPTDGAVMAAWVDLAGALDADGGGVVVNGPESSATDGGVLAAIRKDDDVKNRVSTVDSGSQPSGVIASVLALREQLTGGNGAYGSGSGVRGPLPTLASSVAGSK